MTIHCVQTQSVPAIPWRNGGGVTRELLIWPLTNDPQRPSWDVRISVATIDRNGSFSVFEKVQRWFAVLDGAGVKLEFPNQVKTQTPLTAPLHFDGGDPPICTLLDGSTRDLNLMCQHGQARMSLMTEGEAFAVQSNLRAIYCVSPGVWRDSTGQSQVLSAHSFLWSDDVDATTRWFFDSLDTSIPPHGFWLHYQRQDKDPV